MTDSHDVRQRLRITFSQDERIKYVGHLDMARTWERALRRADLPVSYSQGFNPQLRITFAAAMPVGFTGLGEVVDLVLDYPMEVNEFRQRLEKQLPQAIQLLDVRAVDRRQPALQAMLRAAEYRVGVESNLPTEEVANRVLSFLQAPEVQRERKRKDKVVRYDLRPLVEDLRYEGYQNGQHEFWMRLHSEPAKTGRPDEVLMALGFDPLGAFIERQRLIFAETLPASVAHSSQRVLASVESEIDLESDSLATLACA